MKAISKLFEIVFATTRCSVCGCKVTDNSMDVCEDKHCQYEYYSAEEYASTMDYADYEEDEYYIDR